ncbi:MAG: DUF3089 domain-containing protein [Bacteroidota bacterium]|nr:DUF3089 domain-containing protein [Bacteroidota bacterium]
MGRHLILSILTLFLFSCSEKYQSFRSNYTFKSKDGTPDYNDLHYWAAHPWKWDPSDSVSKPLRNEPVDSSVDVFFLYPTTYTHKIKKNNASIDDDYLNAKTDYTTILYQASVFNQHCRVFSPRYRQASIKLFFTKDEKQKEQGFDMAYTDIKTAFDYYLQHWNQGRPIIIAGHSQGSKMAERLLKEYFENKPLQNKLVVAYIAGWSVPKEYFDSLKMCSDSLQTGCICSWRTLRNGYVPSYLKFEKGNSFVTNPLTWTIDQQYAPRTLNKGSVLKKFNKIYKNTTDAKISNGFLYVKRPKFPWSFLYFSKNYHPGDINLYYMNIRENIWQRISAFNKK